LTPLIISNVVNPHIGSQLVAVEGFSARHEETVNISIRDIGLPIQCSNVSGRNV
jgi:hypothetical protein